MAVNKRKRRNGTGPFRGSAQRKLTGRKGKRKLRGERCLKKV
jgi:hypothetical protein